MPTPPPPLRSVHTTSFPQLLAELGCSLLVTTYQAGKLVILRNDGGVLNTHFRNFDKPMGLAVDRGRLAVGTSAGIQEFHDVPAVCAKLDEPATSVDAQPQPSTSKSGPNSGVARHDGCFLPRRTHVTGDVQIHEMAWIDDDLWFVNTAFSCLSTRSEVHSFDVRWRPPFIRELLPADCCHLNGLAVRDGRAAYVTALGETSGPAAWRDNKRNGGVLVDVASGEVIARGLSMPHSPRWHRGELWLLESGDGSLGRVDLASGRYEPIVQLPGFTRGLSMVGRHAFVGLSQVRESAVFSGIPLVERLAERVCGVWVVDVEAGRTIAFVRFEEAVQEIFAVEALAGIHYPDVVNDDAELIGRSYVLPDDALEFVPASLRAGGRQ